MTKQNHRRRAIGWSARLLIIFSLTLVLATGCFRAPQRGQPGGEAPAVVTVWHTLRGAEKAALKSQVQRIMQENPAIIIKLKYVPEQSFVTMSFEAEAGGEGPEVFLAPREILWQLYAKGELTPVVQYLSDAYPAELAQFRFYNRLYAQPWLTDVPLLFYRTDSAAAPASLTDLFAKGGLAATILDTESLAPWWTAQGGGVWTHNAPQLNSAADLAFLQQLLAWRGAGQLRVDPNALTLFADKQVPYLLGWAGQAPSLTALKIPWQALSLTALSAGKGRVLPGTTLGIANSAVKTTGAMVQPVRVVEDALLKPEVEAAVAQAGQLLPASGAYYLSGAGRQGIGPPVSQSLQDIWPLAGDAPERKLLPAEDAAWAQAASGALSPQDALNRAQTEAVKAVGNAGG
ncbi:Bacterial extracellular solute-binding protein [Acididesulfobacillus acetoxydans]|uniref:Bacterial extracellular solute-binding protein n=1 Tax=Acididesulfobacillus acetoxydans TaxID=1561005 RepID=A0A8S0WVL6_9FIRM|nr:extracellular solute-binding protein [Acididesulfobacillus acetoxydans]CAA7599691.1 Bacterial extracellular solute-binding protein [Acididesulfobacillus acetoxydans]CEJ06243.1 Carbohydrate ABC transporter substrate-binding protein, CUT1 [Acididesulfobacillus acetoxydans]